MNGAYVIAVLLALIAGVSLAPDIGYTLTSLGWSAVGFLSGIGLGWLIWGRR